MYRTGKDHYRTVGPVENLGRFEYHESIFLFW